MGRLRGSIQCPSPGSSPSWVPLQAHAAAASGRAYVRDIMAERSAQLLAAIREELRVVGTTRNRDIRHAVVKQVFCSKLSVHVDEYPVGGLPLARMTCDRVAMIEVRMRRRIKLDYTFFWAASVHLQTHCVHPGRCPPRSRVHGWPASSRARARIVIARQRPLATRLISLESISPQSEPTSPRAMREGMPRPHQAGSGRRPIGCAP